MDVHKPTWCEDVSGALGSNSQNPNADTVMFEVGTNVKPAVSAVPSIVRNGVPFEKLVTAGACARQLPTPIRSRVINPLRLTIRVGQHIAGQFSTYCGDVIKVTVIIDTSIRFRRAFAFMESIG